MSVSRESSVKYAGGTATEEKTKQGEKIKEMYDSLKFPIEEHCRL